MMLSSPEPGHGEAPSDRSLMNQGLLVCGGAAPSQPVQTLESELWAGGVSAPFTLTEGAGHLRTEEVRWLGGPSGVWREARGFGHGSSWGLINP